MPLYLKSHSYGEYVFDHSWARAFRLFSRVPYYPKLLSCVPFTPVTGPRLMAAGTPEQAARAQAALAEALCVLCEQLGSSSAHVTFPAKTEWEFLAARGFLQRTGIQYHWINDRNYSSFEEFLGGLKQSRRKNIRQERNKVARPSSLIPHPSSLIPLPHPSSLNSFQNTRYERARVLGTRALQISMNAPVLVQLDGETDPLEIAGKELREKRIPFTVRRYLPDGSWEDWGVDELIVEDPDRRRGL